MPTGIDRRLNGLFSPVDQRALCIACDHGLMTDPYKSWLNITRVMDGAMHASVDGILSSAGQINRFSTHYGKGNLPSWIVRTDWTNLLRYREDHTGGSTILPVNRVEYRRLMKAHEVLYRYGGSASIGFLFVDPEGKLETITVDASRQLIEESHRVGLPCIIEVLTLIPANSQASSYELLKHGVLKALDLGADAIKMPLTAELEEFCSIIHRAGRRLFVLGGSNLSDEDLFVNLMQKAVSTGVDGLLVGRNILNAKDPGGLILKLRSVVHPAGN